MVIINPHIKKQLQDLKKIPYNSIKSASAVIVDMPIGQMKSHDLGRALYVVTNAFTELTHKQQVIVKVIKQSQEDIKKAIENKDFTKEELIDYSMRRAAPLEVVENLQSIEEEGEIYESIEDIWPDYPTKDDFFFNEDEY